MLHGMDIGFASNVDIESSPPSKMDLLHVSESSLGKVIFDVKSDGVYYRTVIAQSSLRQFSHIDADISLMKILISPQTFVDVSVIWHRLKSERIMKSSCWLVMEEA